MSFASSAFTVRIDGSTIASENDLLCRMLQAFGLISPEESGAARGRATDDALSGVLTRFLCTLAPLGTTATLVIESGGELPEAVAARVEWLSRLEADGRRLLQVVHENFDGDRLSDSDEEPAPALAADATWNGVPLVVAVIVALMGSVLAVGLSVIVYHQLGF